MKKIINKIKYNIKHLGLADGLKFSWNTFLGKEVLSHVTINDLPLHIRTRTSDMSVAVSSLTEEEYANIKCEDPKVIIDAGANIGTSSIYFSIKYPNAKIYAIELEDENYNILLKNIENYKNIVPIKAGLWGKEETKKIQNRKTGPWGYTIVETDNKISETGQDIECVTIKTLMEKYKFNTVDILKIDIEGSEKEVLDNSEEWINQVKVLTVELHDRICMGCDRSFYLATQNFTKFEKNGEKITAYHEDMLSE